MKKVGTIILSIAFALFTVAEIIRNFRAEDPIGYFSAQPLRLLWAVAIAVAGGLAILIFQSLSPRWQWRTKLLTLGSGASVLVAFTGFMLFTSIRLVSFAGTAKSSLYFMLPPLYCGIMTAFLWHQFYRVYKKRVA